MASPHRHLPRTVVVLGLVSLLNDTASAMVTPLSPLFLTATLGAGAAAVGLVEGVAEATASLLKVVSGWLADRGWNRKGLVVAGYGVSNTARPLIGLALGWVSVLALRFLDRVGKGIRTAPRDALIATAVVAAERGRAFGLQRGLDHTGAMIGPLAAFVLLTAFAFAADGAVTVWGLFLAYAAALAATKGAERALVGDCAPAAARATAYGLYHLACGLFTHLLVALSLHDHTAGWGIGEEKALAKQDLRRAEATAAHEPPQWTALAYRYPSKIRRRDARSRGRSGTACLW